MIVPQHLPAPLLDVMTMSERLGGELVVFAPDDRVAFVNEAFRRHYYFCNFDALNYKTLFWSCINHGLYNPSQLRMSADEYITAASAVRRANEQFDFIKRYANGDMLAHHRAVDGWSVQVRLPTDSPLWRGGFGGVSPRSLAEAFGAAEATRSLRRAFDALGTGAVFMRADNEVTWTNAAAAHSLLGLRGVFVADGRMVFDDPTLAADFSLALNAVLEGEIDRRKYIALPRVKGPSATCALVKYAEREAVLLISPDLNDDNLRAALIGFGLTAAECEVALLVAEGHKPAVIGQMTSKSVNTVRAQLASIFKKLGEDTPKSRAGVSNAILGAAAVSGVRRALQSIKRQR